jgi:hypothetical protein
MVAIVNLEAEVRGDTVIYDLKLSRTGALAGWMNGGVIRFMAKLKLTDADADAIFTRTTPASGIVWVDQAAVEPTATLTIAKTDYPAALLPGKDKTLHYEVEYEESNGRRETVQKGELPILGDVIRGA